MKGILVVLICYILFENAKHVNSIEFECENEGFALEESDNCGVYYYCVKSANNDFFPVKFKCPQGEEFSLLEHKCVPEDSNECAKLPEIPNDSPLLLDDFICPSSGRFPNVESPDCKSYYVCSNIMIPVLTNCPSTTVFSWVSMKCVVSSAFTCPNKMTTTTEATTSPTDYEVTTQDYFTTTDTENPFPESTTEQNALTSSSPPSFICTSNGRFSDPESIDCKGYYLCTENTEGLFEATLNQCPSITMFCPASGKCVLPSEYDCPAVVITTANPSEKPSTTVTTSSSTEASTLTTPPTTKLSTDVIISTTDVITATNEPSKNESFACTGNGRFPDPESIDCRSYYLCTETTDGFFQTILNQCPMDTIFHPENSKCVLPSSYHCSKEETTSPNPTEMPTTAETSVLSSVTLTITTPETSTPVTTTQVPPSFESFVCPAVGRFPDPLSTNCESYYLCSTTVTGVYNPVLTQCPQGTLFSADQNRCVLVSQYQCPTSITSSTVKPTSPETTPSTTPTLGKFVCTSIGRHPDTTQPDCSKYKYCLLTATNVFLEYTFNCPTGSYFNALELRCSIGYNCPNVYTTVTPESTTDLSLMTTPFYCTSAGRFPDPTSKGCDTYIMCMRTAVGNIQNYNFKCPNGSKFSPTESKCSTSYSCV